MVGNDLVPHRREAMSRETIVQGHMRIMTTTMAKIGDTVRKFILNIVKQVVEGRDFTLTGLHQECKRRMNPRAPRFKNLGINRPPEESTITATTPENIFRLIKAARGAVKNLTGLLWNTLPKWIAAIGAMAIGEN
jgi:hypothetical protein